MNKYKQVYATMHSSSEGFCKLKYKILSLPMKVKYHEYIGIMYSL